MSQARNCILVFSLFISNFSFAKTVHYELLIENKPINITGKKEVDFALMVNGGIPAPTLEFNEGDDAEIVVKNGLVSEEVSIHWHGILLPPEEDGVAYVNTPPIFPGKERTFKFKIRQYGTYWYHSHTALQEQKGVYGAFIIHPKKETLSYDKEAIVVLSDWSDENPDQIMCNLRKDGDYYLYKKNTLRSYFGAIEAGGLKTHLSNEWSRMGGMDLSDIGYDAFLINGKSNSQLLDARPGERIRIRIINSAASSYFYVSMGIPMEVVSADGVDIEPVYAKEILIGMAETYDILFTVPEHKNYELRATVQDLIGYASTWVGNGDKVYSQTKAPLNLYAPMDHGAHSDPLSNAKEHSDHASASGHEHHVSQNLIETLTVDKLQSQQSTTLPQGAKVHDLKLVLGGDMARYVWHVNGETIAQDRLLNISKNEIVRFSFVNETMMHHPMHLHGHFFRVINGNGDLSPLKHTVDVPPHSSRTIEFYANEPGQWLLHCHNLYHMKTGMARIVRYTDYKLTPDMVQNEKHDPHLHEHIYTHSRLEMSTNHAHAKFRILRTWDEIDLNLEGASVDGKNFSFSKDWELEGDAIYKRWFSNFFHILGGGTLYDEKAYGVIGLGYILPFLLKSSVFVNHKGKFRLDLERHFQWTKYLFSEISYTWRPQWGGKRDSEFEITLMYGPNWAWSFGLMLTEKSLGAGVQFQF